MAFEYREFPEFSWSPSRQRQLDDCPRAYFYRYYLSWNGWLDEAPVDTREAYRLGKLTGLDALLGLEIDKRARELERCARESLTPPSLDVLEARTREALNDAWRAPKQVTMLRAIYFGQDTTTEVERVEGRLRVCLENLATREHWRRIAGRGAEGRVEIPEFGSIAIDGTKVFALPDLVYVHDGTLHVVDWKSGRRSEGYPTQVLLSSFWALSTPAAGAASAIAAHLEYLALGEEEAVEIPDDLAARVSAVMHTGVERMSALLRDPAGNVPLDMETFERRESGLCGTCNFAPMCDRHREAGH